MSPQNSPPIQARTAVFGGTFDPVHNAHLAVAAAALERFALDRILFVPAGNPPHKTGDAITPWEDRVRMVELACAVNPRFEVSRIEENANPSYSIDTIEKLLASGAGPLGFLIGADAFADIRTWRRWEDVVRLVEFIVVTRPGADYEVPHGARVHELPGLDLRISSSEVREGIARGQAGLPIPETVYCYICENRLYRSHVL